MADEAPSCSGNFAEISGENLEDLLAYDDLFLDYFNQFLVSPVFPWRITYNRFTGTFEEVPSEFGELSQSFQTLKYGATDKEREKMLDWARERRLNLFLGSQLFRELKLCKQLLRPIDDQRTAGSQESSQMIRGYSRQTDSCVSSLSNGISHPLDPDAETFLHTNLPFSAPMPRQIFYSQNSSVPSGRVVFDDGYLTSCTQKDRDTLMTNSRTPKSAVSSLKKTNLQSPHLKKPVPSHIATSGSSSICHSALSGLTPKSYTKVREVTFSRENTMLSYNCDSEANKEIVKKAADDSSLAPYKRDFSRSLRALSAPVNYRDFLRIAWFSRFDILFGMPDLAETADTSCPYLKFHDGGNSDANTDTDVRNMEGRLQMTLQEVKEHVFGSYHGMQRFKDFLVNTAGCHLVKFWLHCELFKDCTEDQVDQNVNRKRNQLFRDIQSKYKMSLTQEAREQIQRASTNVSLRHTIFIRTQYDVLRRLRAYWVPRFLLHLERNIDNLPSLSSSRRTTPKWLTQKEHYGSLHFPSISISQLPMCPVNVLNDNHMTPISDKDSQSNAECQVPNKLKDGSNRFLIALTNDQKFGGPFRQYLIRKKNGGLLKILSFWQDVNDYGSGDTKTTDRHIRQGQAWDIYHKYIGNHDKQNIDICNKVRDTIYNTLLNTKDFVSASIFNPVKEEVVFRLEAVWKRSLQEDLKNYLDCKTRAQRGTPPSSADAIDVSLQDGKLVIRRPNPWLKRNIDVSCDQRSRWSAFGKVNWMELDEEEKRLRKCQIIEEKRQRDRNRKQAIRAAHKRRQEEKLMALKVKQEPEVSSISRNSDDESPSLPTFKDFLDNKSVISSFKKCIHGVQNGPQVGHMISLYSEIENLKGLMTLNSSKPAVVSKKTDLANHIQKTYLNENSSKFISLLQRELITEDVVVNPDGKVLDNIQEKIGEKIENAFGTFLMTRSDDAGISEEELAMMSPADLITVLTKTEKEEITQVTKKPVGQRKKLKHAGQAVATRDDHLELRHDLHQCASGQLSLRMIYFHIYLKKHVDEDYLPFLDKDLFFYIECEKAKESLTRLLNENERKRRIQNVLEKYLESESAHTMGVDLSQDVYQRTIKLVQQCVASKDYDPTIFDEAQTHVFKELVPYWAGFRKFHRTQTNSSKNQHNKPQKLLRIHDDSLKNNVFLPKQVILPSVPHSTVRVLSFSLADGIKWRPASSLCSMHLSTASSQSKSSKQ